MLPGQQFQYLRDHSVPLAHVLHRLTDVLQQARSPVESVAATTFNIPSRIFYPYIYITGEKRWFVRLRIEPTLGAKSDFSTRIGGRDGKEGQGWKETAETDAALERLGKPSARNPTPSPLFQGL